MADPSNHNMGNHQSQEVLEERRGKRRLSSQVELATLTLIVLALFEVGQAYDLLKTLLPYNVGLVVALRGLDAHYNPKRL